MNAVLLSFFVSLSAHAGDGPALDAAEADLSAINDAYDLVRDALVDAKRRKAPRASACLRLPARAIGTLAWDARLAVADVRYAGELGYPATEEEAGRRLASLALIARAYVDTADQCPDVQLAVVPKTARVQFEAPTASDTGGVVAELFPGWAPAIDEGSLLYYEDRGYDPPGNL